jgi:hypothetical protein
MGTGMGMSIVVLVVFWAEIARLWLVDGPKIPLLFICLWGIGFAGCTLSASGSWYFMAYQAILAAILLIIERYKSAM